MRAMLFAVILSVACGGSDSSAQSNSANFVGTWTGTDTVTINGQASSASGFTHIASLGGDEISIGDVCGNGTGPSATVTGPASATVHSVTCPPSAIGACSSVSLTVTGGTGSISNGTLTLSGSGTLAGCGSSFPYTLSFVGHK